MILKVLRYGKGEKCTIGLFFNNRVFQCYTLEDEIREVKVPGETCIRDGIYEVVLKKHGGFHERDLKRYGKDFHKGMLHILDVPEFTDILIHRVNDDDDTDGCLGVGDQANLPERNWMGSSTSAYKRIYPPIAEALLAGERVFIQYKTI